MRLAELPPRREAARCGRGQGAVLRPGAQQRRRLRATALRARRGQRERRLRARRLQGRCRPRRQEGCGLDRRQLIKVDRNRHDHVVRGCRRPSHRAGHPSVGGMIRQPRRGRPCKPGAERVRRGRSRRTHHRPDRHAVVMRARWRARLRRRPSEGWRPRRRRDRRATRRQEPLPGRSLCWGSPWSNASGQGTRARPQQQVLLGASRRLHLRRWACAGHPSGRWVRRGELPRGGGGALHGRGRGGTR
mmetsp:Transcript_79920/g.231997  ORF Transcript_79920/g.231997 Transcript_79920/m.231997 type:complete len:246 (+) Transcript_79920:666-1403(+)